jgi:hypothetical protein
VENIVLQITTRRPLGVTLATILLGFWGITVCFALVLLTLMWLNGARVRFEIVPDVLGLANLPLAWSLWKLKPWTYLATLLLQGAMLLNFAVMTALMPASADTNYCKMSFCFLYLS